MGWSLSSSSSNFLVIMQSDMLFFSLLLYIRGYLLVLLIQVDGIKSGNLSNRDACTQSFK